MSELVEAIRSARKAGRVGRWFRGGDVRRACPGWAEHTYFNFLGKHRDGNPGGCTVYFIQRDDGMYRLAEDIDPE